MTIKSIPARDNGTSLGHVPTLFWCAKCESRQPLKGGKRLPFFRCAGCVAPKSVKVDSSDDADKHSTGVAL